MYLPLTTLCLPLLLTRISSAHIPLSRRTSNNGTTTTNSTTDDPTLLDNEIIGTDPPQPPATHGYALNHIGLQVSNITATRAFYGDVLGFRFIFSFPIEYSNTSGTHLVTYMGYPFGDGKVGDQTGKEIKEGLRGRDGLIEFLSAEGDSSNEPIQSKVHGFSHLGITVPNVTATQERLNSFNVPILKRSGVDANDDIDVYFGLDEGATENFPPKFKESFQGFLMALDPDGYVLEFTGREG